MADMGSEIDAVFYRLMHRAAVAAQTDRPTERRRQKRLPYQVCQRVAPWDGQRFPDPGRFLLVPCHDLTRGGFSFLLPYRPDFQAVVVELMQLSEEIYLGADIVRVARVQIASGGAVKHLRPASQRFAEDEAGSGLGAMHLVGCRFTRRLFRPRHAGPAAAREN